MMNAEIIAPDGWIMIPVSLENNMKTYQFSKGCLHGYVSFDKLFWSKTRCYWYSLHDNKGFRRKTEKPIEAFKVLDEAINAFFKEIESL